MSIATARTVLRWLLAAFMMAAGANHFRAPALYAAMMPPWLPWPSLLSAVAAVSLLRYLLFGLR